MTYVFRCPSCGHEFEMTATVAEYASRRAPACPQCGKEARRVYTPILVMSAANKGASKGEASGGAGGACGCGGSCSCGH